jgi:hypothetical protein
MNQDKSEHWQELCKQAQNENDPVKLLALVQEINRLLADKGERSKKTQTGDDKINDINIGPTTAG